VSGALAEATAGTIREIAAACKELEADVVVFVNSVTDQQRQMLSAMLDRAVLGGDEVTRLQPGPTDR
jgi:50S ribosomal subunit-associated GTPase HflX